MDLKEGAANPSRISNVIPTARASPPCINMITVI
jgi:hypothetical protein